MPILDVTVVGGSAAAHDDTAQRIADASGEVLGARRGGCWVRLHRLDAADYAESGGAAPDVAPVFVRVVRHELPPPADRARSAGALADAIARVLSRPRENVHVLFEPAAAGRIAFGGELASGPPRHRAGSGAKWEAIVGYSRVVRVGELVWVTGTTALGAAAEGAAGAPVGIGDAYAQAVQCIANLERALASVGGDLGDVVRTRMFVVDIARDWPAIGSAHAEAFGDVRPATTMVEVRRLIDDWMLVEIEADAHLGG
jgi:enamine deaminase RidA (YjgF/YER057c/UK114 family)